MPIFPDALVTAVLGYGVVFVGLILLMTVIAVTGKVMTAKKAAPVASAASPAAAAPSAPTAVPAKTGPVAPGAAGEIALNGVDERDAAMVMAIVADKLGVPVNELRFKSIKEVK